MTERAEDRPDRDHGAADRRLADAGRQHDPALDLHPPPRGRGDAPGRRDPLVHPLAVHDRGGRRRLRGRPGGHTDPVAGQDHDRRPAERQLLASSPRRTTARSPSRRWSRSSSPPRCWSRRSAPASPCAASSRSERPHESRRGSRPRGSRCSPCLPPASGSAATRRSCPPSLRDALRRRLRRARPSKRPKLIEDNYYRAVSPDGADQLLAAGHGPRACGSATTTASPTTSRRRRLARFNEEISGRFSGIGLSVTEVKKGLRVDRVFKRSPAEQAGIEVGEVDRLGRRRLDRRRRQPKSRPRRSRARKGPR